MAKQPNSVRFRGLPRFKGALSFTKRSSEVCSIIHDGEIIGKGVFMSSTGKEFRVLFTSDEQKSYAHIVHNKNGRAGLHGYYEGDNVYVTGVYYPVTKMGSKKMLHRIRAAQELEKEGDNSVFTGKQRSHETYIPPVVKQLTVGIGFVEKEKPVMDKRVAQKNEMTDFELATEKERKIEQLKCFQYAHAQLKMTGLRMALTDSGYSYDEIEKLKTMLSVCKSYMSHRAYK